MYGKARPAAPALEARTRFVRKDASVRSIKRSLDGRDTITVGPLTRHACDDPWIEGQSLQTLLLQRARGAGPDPAGIIQPATAWLQQMRREARRHSTGLLPGRYLDATWQNTYLVGGSCRFIDLEWEWHRALPVTVLLIRSINYFLEDAETLDDLNPRLWAASRLRLIKRLARCLGVDLSRADFNAWLDIDTAFYCTVEGGSRARARLHGRLRLHNRHLPAIVSELWQLTRKLSPLT
jgi:hypothetical protein